MKNISLKTKIITGLITGGMLLSSVSTAFAATAIPLNTNAKAPSSRNECRQRDSKRQQGLEKNLKKLVTDKTLTQDQANKIKAVMIKAKAEKKSNFEKTKTMTKQQRKTYMNSKKKNHINSFKSLVENGTITQAQADKLGLGYHHHGSSSNNHM
jgi:uncharacterized protein YaiL (DUF2058 family)